MNTKLTTLKTELREFIELSKTQRVAPWYMDSARGVRSADKDAICYPFGDIATEESTATFIARARNISPAMAECLLVAVEGLEDTGNEKIFSVGTTEPTCPSHAAVKATNTLQQILNIWEAAK